ncbi:MAG: ATPase, T2SS/T4P/T4SS family [Candidatus Omnitrophica bacterium]|nr:ATPase, T2SS/T4P/T4SS family [Candidatus Omnitrophota bacterium]
MARLIDALIQEGLVTAEQLREARVKQVGAKKPLHELLVEMGAVDEEILIGVAAKVFKMPVAKLGDETVDTALMKLVPYEMTKQYGVFPLRRKAGLLVLAMSDPVDIVAEDAVRAAAKMEIQPILSTKSEIAAMIEKYYHADESVYDLLKNITEDVRINVTLRAETEGASGEDSIIRDAASPVARLVNLILADAVKLAASDIHIEPYERYLKVRYRIDGDLRDIMNIPDSLRFAVLNRIKILTDLDLAETRKPQDGRTRIQAYGRDINLRVSTVPTYYGQKAVLRLLDPQGAMVQLDKIGLAEAEKNILKEACSKSQGMILVTGPTGSGKTSTLYAALNFIRNEKSNIITIEDPVEYVIEGISQIQVNPVKEVTFANGLRSILRQDPNVILVGEIRDKETADIAFRASLTGHLVLSSLHTNSAAATISRLFDIGLEPYLVASSLSIVVAQRLVKLICPACRQEYIPAQSLLDVFRPYLDAYDIRTFFRGKGCRQCAFSGYAGRTAIFEVMRLDDTIKNLIVNRAAEDEIFKAAQSNGLIMLADAGMRKLKEGVTTLEELGKVVNVVNPEQNEPARVGSRARPVILVADDEDDIAKVIMVRLKNAGYDAVRAVDGEQAVECAVKEKPDLIIMDVMMPRMDGVQATRIIRSRLQTAAIPIVMLTAKSDLESELAGLDAGADDYLAKPFDAARLLARIKMLLKRNVHSDA